jgi:hypothetical protein
MRFTPSSGFHRIFVAGGNVTPPLYLQWTGSMSAFPQADLRGQIVPRIHFNYGFGADDLRLPGLR